jgi:hypothetical protein
MSDRALRPVLREKKDIGPRFMLLLLGLIGVCLVLMLGIAYLLFPRELRDQRFAGPFPNFPAPVPQPSPPVDMQLFYAREMQRLDSVGWIDKAAGTVHIPIDQAMKAVAAEGIPGWPTGSASASEGSRR